MKHVNYEDEHKIKLSGMPTIVKVNSFPTGIAVLRVDLPFNLSHLAKRGVKKAFIIAQTQKTVSGLLGKDVAILNEMRKELKIKILKKYPTLKDHMNISVSARIHYGVNITGTFAYVQDIQRLQETLDNCGFSGVPLLTFEFPLDDNLTWIQFCKFRTGFVASRVGKKIFDQWKPEELFKILDTNNILKKLGVYVCNIHKASGEWYTCKVLKRNKK